jgi:DNA polymerase-3 subunit epsilon
MAHRPIYYDTETTGVRAEHDRIVEIAAFDPVRNKTFEQLINPGCPIPKEASAIHKITDEMVANSPSFADVAAEFINFCDGDVVLIAHNNDNFDIHFLRHEFSRSELSFPSWKFLDTLKWARRYRPDLPRHTLQFLRETYGVPANNAHRALDDVVVLHQVFSMMTDDLEIDAIYNLLNKPRVLQHMPFGKHQGVPLKSIPKEYVLWLAKSGAFDKPENSELKSSFEKLGLLSK